MQFGSLIAWGIGHIQSDIFASYQVSQAIILSLWVNVTEIARLFSYSLVLLRLRLLLLFCEMAFLNTYQTSLLRTPRIFLPDSPVRAKFLKGGDKQVAVER